MKAMILAAGIGSRLKPFTDEHPKALAPVNGKPVLQRNVEFLQQYGITEIIVNVHHFASQIIEAIDRNNGWGSKITISNEEDDILETGGGIKNAAWYFKGEDNFLVMNADMLTDMNLNALIQCHVKEKALATLATTNRHSSRNLLFNIDGQLAGWRNNNTGDFKPSDLFINYRETELTPKAFSGIQVLNTDIFRHIHFSGKFSMIDVYLDLCRQHKIVAFDHSNSKLIDIGTMDKLALAGDLFD
jgi:MurNAc alpha-1-phosphate uridylyltransferase